MKGCSLTVMDSYWATRLTQSEYMRPRQGIVTEG